jgi:hypothetical protein
VSAAVAGCCSGGGGSCLCWPAATGLLPLACWLLPWLAVAAADCCNAGCCFLLRLLLLPLVLQIA